MEGGVTSIDAETEFLASKKESGNEWELFKENVRPLKRGRNASLLNHSLRSHSDPLLKKSLLEHRRKLIEAIDEYEGDDPLQPWIECIKWVQESFPTGGDCSGLVVIYEQCVRSFWHSDRYKDDLRYLKVWLEYADNCADAEVIFIFLEANQIGQTHSLYYISYASHMESKNKLRKADEIFNLGIARKAQPMEKLESAYKKFLLHSTKRSKAIENEPINNHQPVRSFGTVLATGEARRQGTQKSDPCMGGRNTKLQRIDGNIPFTIYKDTNNRTTTRHQPESLRGDLRSWQTLGTRVERNKENAAVPSKWTSHRIPQKAGSRAQPATASTLEIFVDDECAELPSTNSGSEHLEPFMLQLRRGDRRDLKKETELLKENPLRNFPLNSLPR